MLSQLRGVVRPRCRTALQRHVLSLACPALRFARPPVSSASICGRQYMSTVRGMNLRRPELLHRRGPPGSKQGKRKNRKGNGEKEKQTPEVVGKGDKSGKKSSALSQRVPAWLQRKQAEEGVDIIPIFMPTSANWSMTFGVNALLAAQAFVVTLAVPYFIWVAQKEDEYNERLREEATTDEELEAIDPYSADLKRFSGAVMVAVTAVAWYVVWTLCVRYPVAGWLRFARVLESGGSEGGGVSSTVTKSGRNVLASLHFRSFSPIGAHEHVYVRDDLNRMLETDDYWALEFDTGGARPESGVHLIRQKACEVFRSDILREYLFGDGDDFVVSDKPAPRSQYKDRAQLVAGEK